MMSLQQVGQLLTLIALNDNRTWTPETALSWHEILGDLDYDAAVSAMYAHFRESSDFLMPAHIVARVKHADPARPVTMSPEAPESCEPGDHRWMPDGTCLFCDSRRLPAIEGRTTSRGAPKPNNFEALCAAHGDPVRWAAEIARYNEQLQVAGFSPVVSRLRR